MKRINCPVCGEKFKVRSCGNTDGATYKVDRTKRVRHKVKRVPTRLRKVTQGSKYQITLSCMCKGDGGAQKKTQVIGRSKAHTMFLLRRWVKRNSSHNKSESVV